ncbi:MAG TPA: hypothetical protein VGO62_05070, partial [Myxococcota bacterium]
MRVERVWRVLAGISLLVLAQYFASRELFDPDTWWHIVNGNAVVATGLEAPMSALGAHHCPDSTPLVHRFSDPVFAWLWNQGGFGALFAARAAAAAVLAIVIAWSLRSQSALFVAAAGGLVVADVAGRLADRPELLSYALLGVQLWLFFAVVYAVRARSAALGVVAIALVEL